MAFSFIELISSSDALTKREAAILKICPPAIITSAEVIIAEYDAILGQLEHEDFYNHLSNYTNLLLTEREGRTGEYWPEVVAVRTERRPSADRAQRGPYKTTDIPRYGSS